MKIGIITIYEPITNLGSFLQAFALKTFLEKQGHDVYFIKNTSALKLAAKRIFKLNPKREFFLRITKSIKFLSDNKKLKLVDKKNMDKENFDLLIYGSDEIWNLENKYFRSPLFWGQDTSTKNKIAYAISIGALTDETLAQYNQFTTEIKNFNNIFPRDQKTLSFAKNIVGSDLPIVCDPTLLLPVKEYTKPIKIPKEKYLLVYTYGVDKNMQDRIVNFARKNNLKIISPCFWHIFADKVIECSALQFSSLIEHAEYVFTSTFHGAIFTLLNHKKCCILPVRKKVEYLVRQLGEEAHLINDSCTDAEFEKTITFPFDDEEFENRLLKLRNGSQKILLEAIKCLEN